MKAIIAAALVFAAQSAFAAEITPARQAYAVNVDSLSVATVGQLGWPMQEVKVQATFGNACVVPSADELVSITTYSDDLNTLNIALGVESDRVCTMEYAPVTVTINLGQHVRPADGLFSKIVVNGVEWSH